MTYPAPPPHPSGARFPEIEQRFVPRHVAVVMDGNGRWANERGLPRTEGHKAGEASLLDVIHGAIEAGVEYLSAYAFSTENWKRSPAEVRFLMGFNRDVIRRRRDELNRLGVRIVWSGRAGKLWKSVIKELEDAQEMTKGNTGLTLQFCVNYGGRTELVDVMREIAQEAVDGKLKPGKLTEKSIAARTCRTSTCSCGHRGSRGRRTSCCGSPRMRRWCSRTCCGRTSIAARCGTRSSSTRSATAASVEPSTR
jgi:undecaprenyl diphosphate synthase